MIEARAYLEGDRAFSSALTEAGARNVALVVAPLRSHVREFVRERDTLAAMVLDTHDLDADATVECAVEVLARTIHSLRSRRTGPAISHNIAREFPLKTPSMMPFYRVDRTSVRDLLSVFDRTNGVRLWCSVRRSGKTTACLDFTAADSVIVSQTCGTGPSANARLFFDRVSDAVASSSRLAGDFVEASVADCAPVAPDGRRKVLIIDEYETLFGFLRAAAERDDYVRYTVVQPLLNQFVEFARENLLVLLGQQSGDVGDPMTFYWVAITPADDGGDRNRFRQLLRGAAGDHPLVPVVLRAPGFVDPNAVMNDLGTVLEGCESELRAPDMRERLARNGFVDFVLISRREFALAPTSSPLQVPEWFPVSAGQEVTARIEDLTWSAGVALSASEAHSGEIKRLLYELDGILLDRVREVGQADHRMVRGLLDRIQRGGGDSVSLGDFLSKARTALDQVKNPRDYTPSARSGTMVGGLWSVTARTAPDGLARVAGGLAKALQVGDPGVEGHEESILAVIGRPANPIVDAGKRWAFDVIVTVRAACQCVTVAAHADAYARYPVRLVGSLSRERGSM